MIQREIKGKLLQLSEKFPVVSLTGPRQSGKTTLLKESFPEYLYTSLEEPDTRIYAESDPRRFLATGQKMIIDEVQRIPELFSYIQTITDQTNQAGQFIISGSQSFLMNERISQSLAGRIAILHLMPFSCSELSSHGLKTESVEELMYNGFYPRLYDREIDAQDFYPNYIQTYIERDVRLLQNIQNLNLFIRFMKLCAGRTGQLLNFSSLANDTGVSVNTAKSWLSVLEASFIVFLLQPHFKNFNKRLVKMPKLYFYDTGLASSLLGISSAKQIETHYQFGALFENLVISELLKKLFHRGMRNNLYFWRDHKGAEIDVIIDQGDSLIPVEIKSSRTYSDSFFSGLHYWRKLAGNHDKQHYVVYGGDGLRETRNGILIGWKELNHIPQ
jgi:predicted AAA+ superfamily ATPase